MLRVLERLDRGSLVVADILDHLFTPGFGHKGRKNAEQYRALYKRSNARRKSFVQDAAEKRDYQRLHSLLYYLKQQGLIVQKNKSDKKKSLFKLTFKGKAKKEKLIKMGWRRNIVYAYEPQKSDTVTIVIFDIPEKEKNKREWLRSVLRGMGFVMAQESVWIARVVLPSVFIEDLQKMNILRYVMISSVAKEGMIGGLV